MLRSMYAAVSGLGAHQVKMDVIGNNISNVNTVGFKGSRVNFKEMLNQTLQSASAPAEDGSRGGINPQQVGLGVGIGSIDVDHTQGNLQPTGINSDLAIDGNGFFVLSNGDANVYTRSGALTLDDSNNLTNASNGFKMQGWLSDVTGVINTNESIEDLIIPMGSSIGASVTSEVSFGKNLDSEVDVYDTVTPSNTPNSKRTATIDVFDTLGAQHTVSVEFTKTVDNNWDWNVIDVTDATITSGDGDIVFKPSGTINTINSTTTNADGEPIIQFTPSGGADPQTVVINFKDMIQYADPYTVDGLEADGYSNGELKSYSISDTGIITGSYSNGLTRAIGQVAIATFNNPAGLTKQGGTLFATSPNSGIAQIGTANKGGRGKIASGSLEMANVDLAQQFTEMITTQRGFQANSKIISTGDEMLQELVNLKR